MTTQVRPSGPLNAKIAFVGMAPASEEIRTGVPFTGSAGRILDKALSQIGVSRKDVYVTNIHDSFLAPGTSLFSLPQGTLTTSLARLRAELEKVRPNVVVPLGDEPLYFLCNLRGIQKWRGSILSSTLIPGLKCVPTVHPAWIVRGMWKWEPVFTHIDLARAVAEAASPEINLPTRNAITGPSLNTVLDYIQECHKHDILSVDIEVQGYTESGAGEIACVGIGYTPNEALCIPFVRSGGGPYWGVPEESRIWRELARLLQKPGLRKVGQNLSFEWIYFWLHRIYPARMWIDTMLLHHTLYPDFGGTEDVWGRKSRKDEPGHSLAFINSQYTKTPYYKDDGRRWSPHLGDHAFWRYNCMDVMVTLECAFKLQEEAQAEGLWDFYCEFHQRPFIHSARMEWFGVAINLEKRELARVELTARAAELQDRIDQKLGYSLNVNSPKQMTTLLYKNKGLKVRVNRKTKRPTADKETLRVFAEQTRDEVLLWIQELRQTLDLKGDIVDQKLGPDNRMHTHYKQGGTDSNRWSSTRSILGTGTNLQNVPRDGIARHLFIPA